MQLKSVMLALLLATTLVPFTTAALSFNEPASVTQLAPGGSATITFTADMDCADFVGIATIEGSGSQSHDVTLTAPAGFTLDKETATLTFSGTPCVEGADPTATVTSDEATVVVTAGPTAPGMQELAIALTSGDVNGSLPITVEYRKGYVFDDDSQVFPATMTMDEDGEWIPLTWTVAIDVTANADTMVMMQVTEKATYGGVTGLFASSPHNFFYVDGVIGYYEGVGDDKVFVPGGKTLTFTYTPTSADWAEDHITFTTWSHWLNNGDMKTNPETVTWTFINGDFEEESNGLPGLGAVPVILALLGAALVAARRKA